MVFKSALVKMKPTLPAERQIIVPFSFPMFEGTFHVRQQAFVLGAIDEETLESSADHGILAHQHDGVAA